MCCKNMSKNSTNLWYYLEERESEMNKKHERTLEAIFKLPVQSNVVWKDCEKLLESLGAEISEGEGSHEFELL